jgi:hypothetical protein
MTYLKTILASAAAVAIAAPAFAAEGPQDMKSDADVKVKTTVTMTDEDVAKMKKKQMDAMRKKHMESMEKTDAMKVDSVKVKTTTTAETTEMDASKINDTVGEILQADGEPSIQSDQEIIVEDYTIEDDEFRTADDDGMIKDNAIVVPGSAGTLTTVTCPAGTTAQPDMTCMITGDYQPDLDE